MPLLSCCGTPTPRGSRRSQVAHAPAGRSLLAADARDTDPGPEPTGLPPPRPVGPPVYSPAAGRSYDTAAATEATSAAGDGERAAVVELGLGRIVALY